MPTKPRLLTDQNAAPIQAVELSDDAVAISVGVASSADNLPSGAEMIRIGLDVDSYIRFASTVTTSNGHYFPKGVEILVVPELATQLAVISADGSSTGQGTMCSIAGSQYHN